MRGGVQRRRLVLRLRPHFLHLRLGARRFDPIAHDALDLERLRRGERVRGVDVGREAILRGGARQLVLRLELLRAIDMRRRRAVGRLLQRDFCLDAMGILRERLLIVEDGRVPVALLGGILRLRDLAASVAHPIAAISITATAPACTRRVIVNIPFPV